MKPNTKFRLKILSLAIIPLLLLSLVTCNTGCAIFGGGSISTNDIARVARVVKVAASTGTQLSIQQHPEWGPGFELAQQDLLELSASTNIDFIQIMSIVQRLPVKQLQSPEAVLAITAGTMILSEFGGASISLDKVQQYPPIAKALAEGIRYGLDNPLPPSPVKPPKTAAPIMPHPVR